MYKVFIWVFEFKEVLVIAKDIDEARSMYYEKTKDNFMVENINNIQPAVYQLPYCNIFYTS